MCVSVFVFVFHQKEVKIRKEAKNDSGRLFDQ